MPIYTGKSPDGSDMEEFSGMYVDPNYSNLWSSEPYRPQLKQMRVRDKVLDYMNGKYTLNEVYLQIKAKKCPLNYKCRQYVLDHYDDEGNIIKE